MGFSVLETDVENIVRLSDQPNDTDGLSAQQLKQRFDKAAVDIKNYLNGVLVTQLNDKTGAGRLGAEDKDGNASNVQAELTKAINNATTKLFTLSSLQDTTHATQAYTWIKNGYVAVIKFDNTFYFPHGVSESGGVISGISFYDANEVLIARTDSNRSTLTSNSYIEFAIANDAVTTITKSIANVVKFLETDAVYSSAFIPEYDYQPTTKKYVDDKDALKQNIISDLSAIRSGAALGSTAYQMPSTGIPLSQMAIGVQSAIGLATTAYQLPSTGIPSAQLASEVQVGLSLASTAYQKPNSGIPQAHLTNEVQTTLSNATNVYHKFTDGLSRTDFSSDVQSALSKADSAYQLPSTGIPLSVMASDVQSALSRAGSAITSEQYNPYSATSLMTQQVGKDADGRLWTIPGGGGGAGEWGEITGNISNQTDLMSALASKQNTISDLSSIRSWAALGSTAYQFPSGGVPYNDLANNVRSWLDSGRTAYQKPSAGIPYAHLTSEVQANLDRASSALTSIPSTYRTASQQDALDAYKVNTSDYNPETKTSTMTQQVGKDANGKLWTEPTGGSGEPAAYIKSAFVSGRTITFTNKDDTTISFSDTGTEVSGTNDGTNWNAITIGGTTMSIPSGGSGIAQWGYISGTISSQTDLMSAFASKQNTLVAGANITIDPITNTISATGGGGGGGVWGTITGTLSNQTDLMSVLNTKLTSSDFSAYTASEIQTLWDGVTI